MPEGTSQSVVRLLSLVAWLWDHPGVGVDEAAAHFGRSKRQMLRDARYLAEVGDSLPGASLDLDWERLEEDGAEVVDPHFWFSIPLYKKASEKAAESLIRLVPEHEKEIRANLAKYLKQLDDLDAEIRGKIAQIPPENRNLVTPHDAFNYFSRSYGMKVVAPQGVSTNSEVANADIEKTADFIVSHKVKAVFAESTTNPARMKKLQEICKAKGFDVEIVSGEGNELFSDSLAPEGQKGDTYITMYRSNVDLIVSHLK